MEKMSPEVYHDEHVLSVEQTQELLSILQKRFEENQERHEGVDWSRVQSSLEANPKALWSIHEMEVAGHEPDVYRVDNEGFDVGTCALNAPVPNNRTCTYPEVEEIAKLMGVDLMDYERYHPLVLSKLSLKEENNLDNKVCVWLKADKEGRKHNSAWYATFYVDRVHYSLELIDKPHMLYERKKKFTFRGTVRVPWN